MKSKINIINKSEYEVVESNIAITIIPEIIKDYKFKLKNINYIYLNDNSLVEINKTFLNKDYLTDVITFNLNENNIVDADIYISLERIKENSKKRCIDFYTELNRVMFHGILHIVGEDDKTDQSMLIMRGKEDFYLEKHNVSRGTK